jgi:hypothetical protein
MVSFAVRAWAGWPVVSPSWRCRRRCDSHLLPAIFSPTSCSLHHLSPLRLCSQPLSLPTPQVPPTPVHKSSMSLLIRCPILPKRRYRLLKPSLPIRPSRAQHNYSLCRIPVGVRESSLRRFLAFQDDVVDGNDVGSDGSTGGVRRQNGWAWSRTPPGRAKLNHGEKSQNHRKSASATFVAHSIASP